MSYRLRNKTRPQADIEIYGGPLHQSRFDGGMNIDTPASEIKDNEIAEGVNIICREHGVEPRPGSIIINKSGFSSLSDTTKLYEFKSNPLKYSQAGINYRKAVCYNSQIRFYGENPEQATSLNPANYTYLTDIEGTYNPGTGDITMIPYRRGFLVFNSSKLSYAELAGAFQINVPNPVHGISDDNSAGDFKYRYLLTLSRISNYAADGTISDYAAANRLVSGSEVVHESGTNDARYNAAGTSTARPTSYGEVFRTTAISVASPYALTNADLKAACSSAAGVTNDLASKHFTHVTVWRNCDFGDAGISVGNNKATFYWVADVDRNAITGGAGFSDTLSDKAIQDTGIILQTQGYEPIPSGSCGEVAGGWMFVADRKNVVSETYLHYCAVAQFPENIGYYFKDIQKWRFNQGIRALRANDDILSIFCESSTHVCNMTSYVASASNIQAVPFLNYFHAVDRSIGIKDWETLDSIDKNTFIAVCSDNSVRIWDTTKWGDDLAYEKCSTEIQRIVPASPLNYEQGSIGRYYNGAYYLYYSKDLSDTKTTHCLRYGFGKKAGYGWTFYEDTPMPNFKRGVCVVDETQGVSRMVVIGASNGLFYWVETFKPFTGAVDVYVSMSEQMDRVETDLGTYGFGGGVDISSSWKFRELIASSESKFLIHDETFHRWRPFTPGAAYDADMSVSMSAYKDGSLTPWETITEQPKTGSLKFQKEVCARRIQLEVLTDATGWKYVGIESNFRSLDKVKMDVAGDVASGSSTVSYPQFQLELASNLNHWITRRDTTIDRATGLAMTATGAPSLVAGPDGKTESAFSFSSSYYTSVVSNTYAADFSLSFWVKTPTVNVDFFAIAGTSAMSCKFTSNTVLSFSGLGTVTVSSVASGWHLFYIKRVGSTISVYQNGVLKGTITSSASLGGGNLVFGMTSASVLIADFRVYSDVKTENGMLYYYDNVLNFEGEQIMPQV